MFVLLKDFWQSVDVSYPDGTRRKIDFKFKFLTVSEFTDKIRLGNDLVLIQEVILDWKNFNDLEGSPIPYSEDNRDYLAEISFLKTQLFEAYGNWLNKGKKGN